MLARVCSVEYLWKQKNRQYEIISDKYKLQDEKAYISFS